MTSALEAITHFDTISPRLTAKPLVVERCTDDVCVILFCKIPPPKRHAPLLILKPDTRIEDAVVINRA